MFLIILFKNHSENKTKKLVSSYTSKSNCVKQHGSHQCFPFTKNICFFMFQCKNMRFITKDSMKVSIYSYSCPKANPWWEKCLDTFFIRGYLFCMLSDGKGVIMGTETGLPGNPPKENQPLQTWLFYDLFFFRIPQRKWGDRAGAGVQFTTLTSELLRNLLSGLRL